MALEKYTDTYYLPLEGVHSEHCALIVDNGLGKIKQIGTHKIELNNQRAVITTDNKEAVAEAIRPSKISAMASPLYVGLSRYSACRAHHVRPAPRALPQLRMV